MCDGAIGKPSGNVDSSKCPGVENVYTIVGRGNPLNVHPAATVYAPEFCRNLRQIKRIKMVQQANREHKPVPDVHLRQLGLACDAIHRVARRSPQRRFEHLRAVMVVQRLGQRHSMVIHYVVQRAICSVVHVVEERLQQQIRKTTKKEEEER